ncbi:MAG: hypothetical protein AB7U05_17660 [Mangrovibacterium sp.]
MKNVIHVGIILTGELIPSWIYQVAAKIAGPDYADLKLIVLNESARPEDDDPKASSFFRLHRKLDRQVFGKRYNFDQLVDTAALFQGVARCSLHPERESGWAEITSHKLDVLLNFSPFDFSTVHFPLARFGVWQYVIGNGNDNRLAYTYEQMANEGPVLEVSVLASNGEFEDEAVIHRSWVPVNYHSIQINQHHAYGLCALIVPRLICGISRLGGKYFFQQKLRYQDTATRGDSEVFPLPSSYKAWMNWWKMVFKYGYQRAVFQDSWSWFILMTKNPQPLPFSASGLTPVIPPRDRFWADPFVVSEDGKTLLFVEEFIYRNNKGHISVLELDKKFRVVGTEKLLEKPYHLSYPFVFEHGHVWYMIPETSGNKTIELYRCDHFPDKWSFVMNLMEEVDAVDSTLFFHEGKWWLFTAISEWLGFSDYKELFVFYSGDLFTTKWEPHPCNPVVTDVQTSRPAGRIFIQNGKIIRPSQDCSIRYGRAVSLNQITILNENSYAEKALLNIEANWDKDLKGVHTFNLDKDMTVVDAYRYRNRFDV